MDHATVLARLLVDAGDVRWTGIALPDSRCPDRWVHDRLHGGADCYLVVHRGQALGYAQLRQVEGIGCPVIWLTSAQRHRGHGVRVIRALMHQSQCAGLQAMVAAIRQDNRASQGAFRRCGWIETGWQARVPYADCGFWALSLEPAASGHGLELAVARFYRASAPLLTLYETVEP